MDMIHNFKAKMQDLSVAKPGDTAALVAVEVEHPQTHAKRVVFVPSQLKDDLQTVEDNIPYNATVVVPKLPEALDQLEEKCFDKAHDDKESLRELTDFASRRPIDGSPTLELSVFLRMNQANIKMERISMLKSLSTTSKGKIEGRNPNVASIKKRNSAYSLTKKFCLVSTCPWSEAAREKQSSERQARSAVNGVVKTKVELTLVDCIGDINLRTAPLLLNHAYGKLTALVKHVIGPSYSNYDLEVRFHASEWKIYVVGFLYSDYYEDINVKIARDGAGLKEVTDEIRGLMGLMPTVCLNSEQLAREHNLSKERADDVAALAREHQNGHSSVLQPLSLIDIPTPPGESDVTDDEILLRRRAAQLGDSYGEDVDTYDAISGICQILMEEGFERIAELYQTVYIESSLDDVLDSFSSEVVKYHCLLQRTGAKGGWTLRREAGESRMEPYIPLLLEATKNKMTAEVCYSREQLEAEDVQVDHGLRGLPFHFFQNWKAVSVLEFLNGCMPSSKAPQLRGPTSQTMVPIISERNEDQTWRKAPDGDEGDHGDEIFLNSRDGEPYMRTSGDIRVLYEERPDGPKTDPMSLGQLASQYRVLVPSQQDHHQEAYDKTLGEIDPVTNVGPDSSDCIAGQPERKAPHSMRLKNGKIMVKRRRGGDAVPHLLFSGAVNKYSNILLWSAWRERESIRVDQEEIETATQREIRLKLFPLSVFPVCKDDSDDDSE